MYIKGGSTLKNCLILLTNSYPYSSEEAFLEPEMPYLAKEFDKIIILAIGLGKDAEKTRETPENADCYNIGKTSKRVSRIMSLLKGAVNSVLPSDTPKDAEAKSNFRKRVFCEYFYARGEREFSLCKDILEKYDFSGYDSVTVYSYWFFVTALVGCKVCELISPKCKSVKFVSRAHGYDVYRYANSLGYLPLREYLLEKVDSVHPCSINGARYIAEQFPKFSDKISPRYLGTDDDGLSEINDDCFHIVSCSRLVDLKRVDRIASSLSLLEGEGKIRWTHIGDGGTMQKIRAFCDEKLGFMEVNLKGWVSNQQVKEFYRNEKVDLFVNVSTTEGLPVSMMEALSFSIPVIATDVGGVSEIVKDGYNGLLISSDFTDEELVIKIKEIINSTQEEKIKMRRNARDFWEENFDAQKNFSQFANEISGKR